MARSIADGAGVILAPNHARPSDGFVMAALSFRVGRYFHYLAALHLFQHGRVRRWLLNRVGGYSVRRYGLDSDALAASVRILAAGERPLVLFPEGTYWRRNDVVGELEDGLAVLARFAAARSSRPIVVHPVAIRYRLPGGHEVVERRLTALERRLGLVPTSKDPTARLLQTYEWIVARCETHYLGGPGTGDVADRMAALAERLLAAIEKRHLDAGIQGSTFRRTSQIRSRLVASMRESAGNDKRLRQDLLDLYVSERLRVHAPEYWLERPTPERLGEAVVRLEEDLFGRVRELGPAHVLIRVGASLTPCGSSPRSSLSAAVRASIQQMLPADCYGHGDENSGGEPRNAVR